MTLYLVPSMGLLLDRFTVFTSCLFNSLNKLERQNIEAANFSIHWFTVLGSVFFSVVSGPSSTAFKDSNYQQTKPLLTNVVHYSLPCFSSDFYIYSFDNMQYFENHSLSICQNNPSIISNVNLDF